MRLTSHTWANLCYCESMNEWMNGFIYRFNKNLKHRTQINSTIFVTSYQFRALKKVTVTVTFCTTCFEANYRFFMNSIQNNCITIATQDAQSHVWSIITFYPYIFFTVSLDYTCGCWLKFKHRAGQRCFELLALIGSPQLSFQRYSQLNKHLGLTGKP